MRIQSIPPPYGRYAEAPAPFTARSVSRTPEIPLTRRYADFSGILHSLPWRAMRQVDYLK